MPYPTFVSPNEGGDPSTSFQDFEKSVSGLSGIELREFSKAPLFLFVTNGSLDCDEVDFGPISSRSTSSLESLLLDSSF